MLLPMLQISSSSAVLVAIALIIIIGYISSDIFRRTRIPEILILMMIGIFLVQIVNFVPVNYLAVLRALAPLFGSLALVVIMFNGSKELKSGVSPSASWKGTLLGILDTLIPLCAVALFMNYAFGWPLIYGAILGTILGETSSVVVIRFIRKVKIESDLFNTMFLESTINSIVAIIFFSFLIIIASNQSVSALSFATYALDYISIAVVIGAIAGIGWLFVLNTFKTANEYLAAIAMAILLYGIVDIFNGAAIIAVLIFGIIIGNKDDLAKMLNLNIQHGEGDEKAVEKELEFLISTFFFVFMGMIVEISEQYLIYGVIVTLLLVVARYLETRIVLYKNKPKDRSLVFSMMPRGVTAATLSTIAYAIGGMYFMQTFYISFIVIVATSIVSSILLNHVVLEVKEEGKDKATSKSQ